MKRKLKEELRKLSTDIITSRNENDIIKLYDAARSLYERIAVLKFIEEKLEDVEVDVSKNEIAKKFERMASAVINENKTVPENSPHEEDIITPGIDTIKHMVSEMPGGLELEEALAKMMGQQEFMKSDKDIVTPVIEEKKMVSPKSLNDKLSPRDIKVGLNDRLAFIKHLFNDNSQEFESTISELNAIDSEERSLAFIEKMVRPEYGNWEGKEEYALRFMALIERRFA